MPETMVLPVPPVPVMAPPAWLSIFVIVEPLFDKPFCAPVITPLFVSRSSVAGAAMVAEA